MLRIAKTSAIVFFLASALTLSACHRTQPIYNVQEHPVPQVAQQKMTDEDIGRTIARAATTTGWRLDPVKPGFYHATITWQDHSASADILYSRQNYSILLDASRNLKEANGEIHRRYNQRVQQLEDEIDRQLYRAAYY